ncbi:MAG: hypothetical protein GY909_13485 [Oligoflexia bacterium]|nr:hypothetical protein [Oligoflexia bacterium]
MKDVITSFRDTLKLYSQDKWILVISFIPVIIGIVLFAYFGSWFISDLNAWGEGLIKEKFESSGTQGFLISLLLGIITIAFFFIVNWTFVLVVSIIASPFNDIISSRAEKAMRGEEPLGIGQSFSKSFGKVFFTVFNEIKKVSMIIFMSIIALIMGFIGILAPLAYVLSAFLMAIGFLDYSWSRHDLSFRDCIADVKKGFFSYGLGGALFVILMGIPFVNLVSLPFGVLYFTVLFLKKVEKEQSQGELVNG